MQTSRDVWRTLTSTYTRPPAAGTSGPSALLCACASPRACGFGRRVLYYGGFASSFVAGMALVSGLHPVHPASGARLWERCGSGERGGAERPRGGGGSEAGDQRARIQLFRSFPRKPVQGGPNSSLLSLFTGSSVPRLRLGFRRGERGSCSHRSGDLTVLCVLSYSNSLSARRGMVLTRLSFSSLWRSGIR